MSIINYLREKSNNTIKLAKSKIVKIVSVGTLIIALAGCVFDDDNPSLEEIVEMVSTPAEAQQFMNASIGYAYSDVENPDQRNIGLNGANCQSFCTTFNRGEGICRDGAIAVAAMLQDDGYPSLILDICYGNNEAHSIFAYQSKDGKWGSAGLNSSDFEPPTYESIEELARATARKFGKRMSGYKLFDLSFLDLIEGTNDGLVRKDPFLIEDSCNDIGSVEIVETDNGYEVSKTNSEAISRSTYTFDVFDNSIYTETWTGSDSMPETYEWTVLDRHPSRLPLETVEERMSEFEEYREHTWLTYYEPDKKQEEIQEKESWSNGNLVLFIQNTKTYYTSGTLHVLVSKKSIDGDYEIDVIEREEYDPDGNLIDEFNEWVN